MSKMAELYMEIEEDLVAGDEVEVIAARYGTPVMWVLEVAADLEASAVG